MAEEFSNFEKYDIFCTYIRCNKNATLAAVEYFNNFPDRRQPNYKTFKRLDTNLKEYGVFSKTSLQREHNHNPEEERAELVLGAVNINSNTSTREIERQVGVSKSAASRILKKYKYRHYKYRITQSLFPNDPARRLNLCRWYLQKTEENRNFYKSILWSDETYFSNCGLFNRRNTHFWARENPHLNIARRNQVRFGFNVWCGILGNRLIGPIVYNGNLTAERYLQLLSTDVEDILDDLPLTLNNNIWFQQDGAPAHNATAVRQYLHERFGNRVIATHGNVPWPPRSPDLTPLDFFLWGYLKNKVYGIHNFDSVEALENCVLQTFRTIDQRTLEKVTRSVFERCQKCIECSGGVFEQFL